MLRESDPSVPEQPSSRIILHVRRCSSAERGQGLRPFSRTPFSASGILPALRSGQVSLDEAEHFLHNRGASVATLRWCSGSSRNAVRIHPGFRVRLRRNPQRTHRKVGFPREETLSLILCKDERLLTRTKKSAYHFISQSAQPHQVKSPLHSLRSSFCRP